MSGVVDSFARTICRLSDFPDDSNQAAFVRGVVRSWADTHLRRDAAGRQAPLDDLVAFLRTFDLAYRARRLRFVTDGLSAWYAHAGEPGYPTRAQLDEGQAHAVGRAGAARRRDGRPEAAHEHDGRRAGDLRPGADRRLRSARAANRRNMRPGTPTSSRGSKEEFGKALDARLAGTAETLYKQLFALSEGWAAERRAELLVRYLGFPYWDVLLFPIQSVADAGERDTIEVVRMSPRDAKLLPPLDPNKPKQLAGFDEDALRRLLRPRRPRERLPLGPPRRRRAPDRARARRRLHRRRARGLVPQGVRRDRRGGGQSALAKAKPLLDHVRSFAGS